MTRVSKLMTATALGVVMALGATGSATAQDDESQYKDAKTRKVEAITLDVHKRIQEAQVLIDGTPDEPKDLAAASIKLDELLERRRINNYERAVVWQLKAQIAFEQDDTPAAIAAYEEILQYSDSIPVPLEVGIIFNLSQLYFIQEDYQKALQYVNDWQSRIAPEFVGASQLNYIAQLHYTLNDYRQALDYIYRAIQLAETVDTVEVKESWYQIALSSHFELEEWTKVRDTLLVLLVNWPKPQYWEQLAGIYGQLNQEEISYSISEAAYKQGFFEDKPLQLVNVAQILIARQAPIKATWVLEKAMAEDKVERNARNLKTLGQAYMMAAEFDKAVDPLSEAAAEEKDATLWAQVGQVYGQLDRLEESADALQRAIDLYRAEGVDENREKIVAYMTQRASSLIELKRFKDAEKELADARRLTKSDRQRRAISQWSSYLKAEKAREDLLASVGENSGN